LRSRCGGSIDLSHTAVIIRRHGCFPQS
jgi:hypothetical protein